MRSEISEVEESRKEEKEWVGRRDSKAQQGSGLVPCKTMTSE